MFKFIKELIASAKEGWQEGLDEVAAEETNSIQPGGFTEAPDVAHAESFGVGLAAPFRVVTFGDWFSVMDKNKGDDQYPPHLYQFGDYPTLEEKRGELAASIKRDFGIEGRESCLNILAGLYRLLDLPTANTPMEGYEGEAFEWKMDQPHAAVLATVVAAHVATAGTDVGYLPKAEAQAVLDDLRQFIQPRYTDWHAFGDAFLLGEQNVGLNNAMGRKVLTKYVGYLRAKPGSPWNNLAW